MNKVTQHGICRFCHAMCSMQVTLEDGRITHLIGDKDNPVYHGYSCVKGRNFHEFHYSPKAGVPAKARKTLSIKSQSLILTSFSSVRVRGPHRWLVFNLHNKTFQPSLGYRSQAFK
ncbi:MAG: hypothetical protein SH820_16980 [Xanthomonadales bacterium]|nr:hypothetical protein [Xanthomonadales bacterium]